MINPHTIPIAPALYELAYDQLARPCGITVTEAVNQLLAATLDPDKAAVAKAKED